MGLPILITEYIWWHYGTALKEIIELERNFLWFGYHLFSIKLLLQTIFSPFSRIQEGYKGLGSMEMLMENVVANMISRAVGFIFRTIIIIIGVMFEALLTVALLPVLIFWVLLPILIPLFFLIGLITILYFI